jgi:acetolactate synthase regulatory subunit
MGLIMERKVIQIEVLNTATALIRVIEVVQRQRVYIHKIVAEENSEDSSIGMISITIRADEEKTRLLKKQCAKVVEVFDVSENVF